jgi:hypothetical protein
MKGICVKTINDQTIILGEEELRLGEKERIKRKKTKVQIDDENKDNSTKCVRYET